MVELEFSRTHVSNCSAIGSTPDPKSSKSSSIVASFSFVAAEGQRPPCWRYAKIVTPANPACLGRFLVSSRHQGLQIRCIPPRQTSIPPEIWRLTRLCYSKSATVSWLCSARPGTSSLPPIKYVCDNEHSRNSPCRAEQARS